MSSLCKVRPSITIKSFHITTTKATTSKNAQYVWISLNSLSFAEPKHPRGFGPARRPTPGKRPKSRQKRRLPETAAYRLRLRDGPANSSAKSPPQTGRPNHPEVSGGGTERSLQETLPEFTSKPYRNPGPFLLPQSHDTCPNDIPKFRFDS